MLSMTNANTDFTVNIKFTHFTVTDFRFRFVSIHPPAHLNPSAGPSRSTVSLKTSVSPLSTPLPSTRIPVMTPTMISTTRSTNDIHYEVQIWRWHPPLRMTYITLYVDTGHYSKMETLRIFLHSVKDPWTISKVGTTKVVPNKIHICCLNNFY